MASPGLAASSPRLVDPQKKAHFNIQLSDRITKPKNSAGEYSSVKFNRKPPQTASSRTSTISQSAGTQYSLTLSDKDKDTNDTNDYVFRGQKTQPKKSYVLIFDPAKQTATLEPLSATYTFNLKSTPTEPSSSKLAQRYPQIQPPKNNDSRDDDLFDDGKSVGASDSEPDAQNPYDWRHFLSRDSGASSPDIHSSLNTLRSDFSRGTPLIAAHKPPPSSSLSKAPPKPRTSTTSQPLPTRKPPASTTKKHPPNPTVRLDRRASTRPTDPQPQKSTSASKPKKPVPKSAEIVHSSDDSSSDHEHNTALTVEDPATSHPPRALASLGLGQSLGLGGAGARGFLKSPSNGPISLHSAANSASGSPEESPFRHKARRQNNDDDDDVIDFGDTGGGGHSSDEEDDGYVEDDEEGSGLDLVDADADADVEEMELGPPVREPLKAAGRRMSVSGLVQEEEEAEEDDWGNDLEAEMMQGLLSQDDEGRPPPPLAKGLGVSMGGDSESESEEE
ncbi:uncharacterized protein BDZ99DRAFT_574880 [Mytilinidion resinicola]|uniref:Transcription elongation factor Eaf N-terminal domain-containing protein n=1 Tax=Mytilinidion resinicola TaxID=574789 RepID=A0A6A6YB03_9PEZI|nr:uncharacterized protein BDZ99DRAFT_574880 [Mytilinidion resinicola]KAF2805285.1 hypothetical protein BDZ99DRAFT_574880 [Mytilinidion resinicola]